MSMHTQMCLAGFIANVSALQFSRSGAPRFHARVGCEHFRKEVDGSFTKLAPTFQDLVIFNDTALAAYERFKKGDSFLASGYIHEYEVESDGTTVVRDEFCRPPHRSRHPAHQVRGQTSPVLGRRRSRRHGASVGRRPVS